MKAKKICKELLPYIVIVLIVVLIRTFFFTPIIVSGSSMDPTLKNNNVMILNKVAKIDRFDIVVIKSKKSRDVLIKRVIGLPGEEIEIKNGVVYINGKKIDTKHKDEITSDYPPTKIKDDEYFVLGDNREISADSRLFGTFNKKEIKGTTRLRLLPIKKFGFVK